MNCHWPRAHQPQCSCYLDLTELAKVIGDVIHRWIESGACWSGWRAG